jgi:hypothetical protein
MSKAGVASASPRGLSFHRTTINLPAPLLREAMEVYATSSPTAAITRALVDAVASHHRRSLLEMDWSDLTPESIESMRKGRSL